MAPSAAPAAAQSAAASANGTANAAGFAKAQPGSSARAAGANLDVGAMLSEVARTRPPSAIRSLFPAELLPGMLSFLAGKPNPQTFPVSAITLTVAPAPGASAPVDVSISGDALAAGMQYGPTNGIRQLNEWLVQWQERIHRRAAPPVGATARPGAGTWRVTIGQGSQDLLTKTFTALLNPGDSALIESPAYTGILPQLSTLKANLAPVASDAEGMCPKSLRSILAGWHTSPATRSHPFPKFVYTTPTGANPAGTTASEQRKREVLAVVREYGILLLEDDPYIFLGFEGLGEDPVTRDRGRSYFSLETDGREQAGDGYVARFDSFSKIIGGGLRIGVLTGPTALVDAVDLDTSSANLQPSGVAQAILLALLQHWGQDGLLQHVDRVAAFYRDRRDVFEQHAHEILGSQGGQKAVAEWVKPVAGMFLWLRLKLPSAEGAPEGDSFALISEKAKAAGVLAVPGVAFMPDGSKTPYVRTSFSIIDEKDVAEAMRRLRSVVEQAWAEQGLELP